MNLAGGYAVWLDEAKRVTREADTITCAHCGGVILIHDASGARRDDIEIGYCSLCDAKTCHKCAGAASCKPFEKKLEKSERRAALLRELGVT